MAADDDDDIELLDVEQIQYPNPDEGDAEYEFPELEMGFGLGFSERAGVAIDGELVPQHHQEPRVRARGISHPESFATSQRKQHDLEGHANYHPGDARSALGVQRAGV